MTHLRDVGQPGDTAHCTTCGATVISAVPDGGWEHLRTVDPATLMPLRWDHPANPDTSTVEAVR